MNFKVKPATFITFFVVLTIIGGFWVFIRMSIFGFALIGVGIINVAIASYKMYEFKKSKKAN